MSDIAHGPECKCLQCQFRAQRGRPPGVPAAVPPTAMPLYEVTLPWLQKDGKPVTVMCSADGFALINQMDLVIRMMQDQCQMLAKLCQRVGVENPAPERRTNAGLFIPR